MAGIGGDLGAGVVQVEEIGEATAGVACSVGHESSTDQAVAAGADVVLIPERRHREVDLGGLAVAGSGLGGLDRPARI